MPYDKFDQCTQPDHDGFGGVCGFPRPCPHHTIMITDDAVIVPKAVKTNAATLRKLFALRKALKH